jgi:ABC-type branched-subunit amino acid transport system ATPase component
VYFLRSGKIVLEGAAAALAERTDLEHIYFGEENTP